MDMSDTREYMKSCYNQLGRRRPDIFLWDEEVYYGDIHEIPEGMCAEGTKKQWRYVASDVCEEEIVKLETSFSITLPPLYKAYISTFSHLIPSLIGRVDNYFGECLEAVMDIPIQTNQDMLGAIEAIFTECNALTMHGYIPVGDFNGWGPLCIDTRHEEEAQMKMVYFDHEHYSQCETREELEQEGIIIFQCFSDFLNCFFIGTIYDCNL